VGETYTIVQTADGGYAVAGYTYGSNWLLKTDAQGKVLWTKTYESNDMGALGSKVTSMIKTNDAGFALAGSADTPNGGTDFWLIKADSKGNAQWNQTYNSGTYKDGSGNEYPRDDVAQSLTQTTDGGYAIVGSASLFRASTSSMVYAAWTVKTDANGKQNWNQGYDAINDPDSGIQIVQSTDGGYAIAGTQNQDSTLLKADSTGKLQWTKTYTDQYKSEFWNQAAGLAQLNDGGYAVAGTFSEVGTSYHSADLGLIRYDATGRQTWIKTYNAAENTTTKTRSRETAYAMIKTSDGAYTIAGTTDSATGTRQDICLIKTETLEQPPQTTPTQNPQQTPIPTTTPTQSTTPQTSTPTQTQPTQTPTTSNNQSPSPGNSQTPPTDTTNNPTETQTPNQQNTPTATNTQPTPNNTGQQNESPTQEGTANITTIAAIAIFVVIAIAITAAIYGIKYKKRGSPKA